MADAQAIASIYNEGIADRIGTFETEPRTAEQIAAWFDGRHPIVVVEEGGEVVAFASTSAYRSRPGYAGSRNSRSDAPRHRRLHPRYNPDAATAARVVLRHFLGCAPAIALHHLRDRQGQPLNVSIP
jgi:hypothetical protein